MIRLYRNHIEKAEELLVQAKAYEARALGCLYEAVVAITQAIKELEEPHDDD
jgi:hypothetical protein